MCFLDQSNIGYHRFYSGLQLHSTHAFDTTKKDQMFVHCKRWKQYIVLRARNIRKYVITTTSVIPYSNYFAHRRHFRCQLPTPYKTITFRWSHDTREHRYSCCFAYDIDITKYVNISQYQRRCCLRDK